MRSKGIWLIPVVAAVGLGIALYLRRDKFEVPENFPVLDADEIGSAPSADESELATFGAGCFWCVEAVFQQLDGVTKVTSGYAGGSITNPTYAQVSSGTSGHAEVVQVTFDAKKITYPELLEVFWRTHDPTTRNRQGHDVGTQYRSVIFYHSERQRQLAEKYRRKIDEAHVFKALLVTEIAPAAEFYPAETEHQNYFAANAQRPYCRNVIRPKVDKLKAVFRDKLKPTD